MLEREGAVDAIGQLLDRARRGTGGALFLIGEAGLGKTSLLDRAGQIAGADTRVALARGEALQTALPFGLVAQVMADLDGPGLPDQRAATPPPGEARASQLYRALRWVDAVAATGPVLIALDDLHWSDPDSLGLLSSLCRRLSSLPVAVIGALRPWPPAGEELALALAQSGQARVERLHPLSEAACRALLSRHLGRRVSRKLVRHAHASTAGNPLLLEQLALTLNTGQPTKDLGSWHLRPGGLVLSRFAGLPEEGLRCARAASVLGSRFRPEVATALARLDGEEADLAREALSRTGLVRQIDIGLAEFTHPLLRDALYDDLPPLTREALHARAFRILSERGMETEAAEHAARGNLLGDGSAIEVLTRSGQAALRTGAVAVATERLKRAVALAGDRPRADLLLLCGEALLAEGRGHEAATVYERLLRQTDSAAETTTQALRMLGRALFLSGDPVEGERRFEQAAALASKDHPTAAVQAVLDLSRAAWLTAGPAGALPFLRRARETARHADEACRAEIEAAWGFVAFVSGDPAGLEATRAPARLAAASDMSALRDLSWHWGSLRNSGRAAKYAERFDEAEAAFSAMFVQAERAQSAHAIVSLAAHHADALIRRGRLEEAVALASRAVDLADLAPMAAGFAHVAQASLLVHLDQWEEAERACERAERVASDEGQWLPLLRAWHLRARRHLDEGRLEEACRLYGQLEAETARLGIGEPCLVPWARGAVTAYVRHERLDDAERVLQWLEGCGGHLPCRWPRIAALAGRATVAEARDDHDAAEAHLQAALVHHGEVELPLERVETMLQLGAFLRRTSRVMRARETLREALTVAEELGSRWLVRLVREELAVARGRRRARHAPPGLTPAEQRVAVLAAAGRSSREIASQLSLSARTVETHLSRVYAKLGIHSQRELMARGAATEGAGGIQ